ncbi:hypothetical protein ACLQ26_07130 [Micromonospora sp. DT43]|uniref:hypothetical protein n=1 Tax=Micromonospora sp. DT43 TaxID=3393440 RepID=UPI003CF27314
MTRLVASAVAGTVLALAALAAPASAADGWQRASVTSDSPSRDARCSDVSFVGEGCFEGYGEWFWLRDTNADDEPVVIHWTHRTFNGTLREGYIYANQGKAAGWTKINKSFEEGLFIYFEVCNADLARHTTSWCGGLEWAAT